MKTLAFALALLIAQPVWSAPRGQRAPSRLLRPLTFVNATGFFGEALGRSALKVDPRCAIFAEGEWKNANVYNHSVIIVENADEDLEITFVMTGDEGMNWVNEFFDSRFFTLREKQDLFGLLNGGLGTRRRTVGRFRVELSRWEPRHHEIVVISLTPRGR